MSTITCALPSWALARKEAVGGVGGRGHQLINALGNVEGVRIVALCDVDQGILARQAAQLKDQGQPVAVYGDLRRVFDDKSVDAVVVATPNHWHALAAVWACQAGKDVYVEKPMSHNIWEGRQMVAAARQSGRIVQAGTQARSSSVLREAFEWVQRGELGPIRFARVIVYRQRSSIGKVAEPTPIPGGVDYDLWCGPVEKHPLRRKQLHYDWHWVWSTGSGEMGNNGVHYIDMCRWVMKLDAPAPRVMSVGGRFSFDDDGETPNTQVAILDYQPAPIYCEIRGLPQKKGSEAMDSFQNTSVGVVLQCEGGYFAGAHLSGAAFDNRGKEIKKFGPTTWAIWTRDIWPTSWRRRAAGRQALCTPMCWKGISPPPVATRSASRIASARPRRRAPPWSGRTRIRCCRTPSRVTVSICARTK